MYPSIRTGRIERRTFFRLRGSSRGLEDTMNSERQRGAAARLVTSVLPDRALPTRILRGPFRGAIIVMNPRNSMRKMLGLYEHELNPWLKLALRRVTRVLDVGANDGYFTFGCAAAFLRLGKGGQIIAFEPQQRHIDTLRESIGKQRVGTTQITLLQTLVGGEIRTGATTLDAVRWQKGDPKCRTNTLVKIDVEGVELDVLAGASSWLNPRNYFVIEIHQRTLLESIARLFAKHGMEVIRVNQRPSPFFGREMRSEENWWLVSNLR